MSTTVQNIIVVLLVVTVLVLVIRRLRRIFRGESSGCNCGFGPGQCPMVKDLNELKDQLPGCSGCDVLAGDRKEGSNGDDGKKTGARG